MSEKSKAASRVLTMNTIAFTVCFAAWMMNGVLVTFLVDNGLFDFDKVTDGLADRHPRVDGFAIVRLPVGMLDGQVRRPNRLRAC